MSKHPCFHLELYGLDSAKSLVSSTGIMRQHRDAQRGACDQSMGGGGNIRLSRALFGGPLYMNQTDVYCRGLNSFEHRDHMFLS